jgi:hypothetical protein
MEGYGHIHAPAALTPGKEAPILLVVGTNMGAISHSEKSHASVDIAVPTFTETKVM